MNNYCSVCGEEHLTAHVELSNHYYRGETKSLETWYSICAICGAENATADQLYHNHELLKSFQADVDARLDDAVRKK